MYNFVIIEDEKAKGLYLEREIQIRILQIYSDIINFS